MELKKVAVRSSIKPIAKLEGIYAKLSKAMGDDFPFAQMSIGHGFRTWSDKRREWHPFSEATAGEVEEINNAAEVIYNKVSQYADDKTVKTLFTVPDESYLFFNNDDGNMHIILTGWGFRKPGPDGINGLEVGKVRIKKKDPAPEPEPDEADILVKVRENHQPVKGVSVKIEYGDDSFSIVTDEKGQAQQHVTISKGAECSVSVDGYESQSRGLTKDETELFIFDKIIENTTPPPPPPEEPDEADILVTVREDSEPVAGKDVAIQYGEKTYNLTTDGSGQARQHVTLAEGVKCTVSVNDYESQSKELVKDTVTEFVFDREKVQRETPPPPPPEEPDEADILVTVKENGESVAGKEVTITYGQEIFTGNTDENGQVKQHVTITDGAKCTVMVDDYDSQTKNALIKDEVNEFVFDREKEQDPPPPPTPQIKVTVLGADGKPLKCTGIHFEQEGKEPLDGQLDENGTTTFDSGRFDTGKDLSALITGSATAYSPVVFQLDDGELEYVLQEKETETKWWLSLLDIAAVAVTALVSYFLVWPVFIAASSALYNGLYN